MAEVWFYRRNLPHWRVDGSCYFVTFRLNRAQPDLAFEERTLVQETLLHGSGRHHHLDAYVVMNDHVHALVRPTSRVLLEDIVRSWKSFSAFKLQRTVGRVGAVWQRECFDRVVRDDGEWLEKMAYIAHNPIKRWPEGGEYPWVYPQP